MGAGVAARAPVLNDRAHQLLRCPRCGAASPARAGSIASVRRRRRCRQLWGGVRQDLGPRRSGASPARRHRPHDGHGHRGCRTSKAAKLSVSRPWEKHPVAAPDRRRAAQRRREGPSAVARPCARAAPSSRTAARPRSTLSRVPAAAGASPAAARWRARRPRLEALAVEAILDEVHALGVDELRHALRRVIARARTARARGRRRPPPRARPRRRAAAWPSRGADVGGAASRARPWPRTRIGSAPRGGLGVERGADRRCTPIAVHVAVRRQRAGVSSNSRKSSVASAAAGLRRTRPARERVGGAPG